MTAPLQDSAILLSALPASRFQQRTASMVALFLLAGFAAILPFARVTGARVPAFVLVQQSLLLTNDLITAALLFGQYAIGRSRGLNILAGGYLFTALIVIPHALSFPGGFSETGLLAAGPQSTAWLYLAWHAVLPLTIVVYALYRDGGDEDEPGASGAGIPIVFTILTASGGVALLTLVAIAGHDWLPPVMAGDHFTGAARIAVGVVLGLILASLMALAKHRQRSVLDLWLMVVMLAWLCAISLGSFISKGRFDVGYYAGRFFATVASTVVLIALLSETIALYARTVRSAAIERRERERRLKEMEAMLVHLGRVGELGRIVSSLIHEVNQPLTAITNYLGAGIHLAEAASAERLKHLLERAAEQANRATGIIRHSRDFISGNQTEKQIADIPEMLRDAVRLALVGTSAESSSVEMRCDPAASDAVFDRVQIEQVVFNLVRNAVEAMAGGARRAITIVTALTGNNMVEVSIADTGPGLSPDIRAKLFEPFITTKASGLGVGLSICRFIIEAHGGQLRAEDNPDGGAVFRFTLPLPARDERRTAGASA